MATATTESPPTPDQKRLRDGQKITARNMVAARTHGGTIAEVRLDAIDQPIENHRQAALHDPAKLDALAASMAERGLLQPVLVYQCDMISHRESYILVYGHRRVAAARQLGWETIRAEIAPAMSEAEVLLERAIENLHREDLNPMEQVTAVQQAVESSGGDVKKTAKSLGVTEAFVRDRLHLAQGLGEKAKQAAYAGLLGLGHLRELVKVRDRQSQDNLAEELTAPDWRSEEPRVPTVEEVRRQVQYELHDLADVPWRLDVPFAGKPACQGCPSNSSSQPDLFGEDLAGHCTDRQCFAAKHSTALNLADAAAQRLIKLKVDKVGKAEVERAVDELRTETDAYDGGIDTAKLAPKVRSQVNLQRPTRNTTRKSKLTPLQKAIQQYGQAVRGWKDRAAAAIARRAGQDAMAEIVVRLVLATKAWEGLPRTDTGFDGQYGGSPKAPKPTKPLNKAMQQAITTATAAMNPDAEWFSRLNELRVLAKLPTCNLNSWRMSGSLTVCGNVLGLRALAGAIRVDPKLPDPPDWQTFKAKAEAPAKRPTKKKSKRTPKKPAAAGRGKTPKQRAAAKKTPSRKRKGGAK